MDVVVDVEVIRTLLTVAMAGTEEESLRYMPAHLLIPGL